MQVEPEKILIQSNQSPLEAASFEKKSFEVCASISANI